MITKLDYVTDGEQRFTVQSIEDPTGGYSGRCLELLGAISQGETLEELKTNMADAIQLVLESIEKDFSPNKKIVIILTGI